MNASLARRLSIRRTTLLGRTAGACPHSSASFLARSPLETILPFRNQQQQRQQQQQQLLLRPLSTEAARVPQHEAFEAAETKSEAASSRHSNAPASSIRDDLATFLDDLQRAAAWNHGQTGKRHDAHLWDYEFCRRVVQQYDAFLSDAVAANAQYNLQADRIRQGSAPSPLQQQQQQQSMPSSKSMSDAEKTLLLPETVILAVKALVKSHLEPHELSTRIRDWERALGHLRQTPLTDHLSLRLLTANGKAGNVGRVLSLLQLRHSRNYRPRQREFVYALTALQAAAQPRSRNIFLNDADQAAIDNPTRWLDAILLNMHQRHYPLTTPLANRMLQCYAAGYTGKAVHHFYRVARQAVASLPMDERPADTSDMPLEYVSFQRKQHVEEETDEVDYMQRQYTGRYQRQPVKVKLQYHSAAPPFYKIPSQIRGKLLPDLNKTDDANKNGRNNSSSRTEGVFKIDRETDPNYSVPLAAAFSFADSLQHGACGHEGIRLDTGSYNALIKACIQRGALWRAMHLIDEVMSKSQVGDPDDDTKPNTMSYNLIIAGMARVGDVMTMQDYYHKLLAAGLKPDAWTVRAIVDGLLNLGDVSAAVTVVQDLFNQHSVLPAYTTHVKILEICLGRGMTFEAKRHVYFLQQLWHWEPNDYHDPAFVTLMRATQQNTQLQKPALQKLFRYFGEELLDTDFL